MEGLNITIDGRLAQVAPGSTLLTACRSSGVDIPTLCNFEGLPSSGACGLCVVEVGGAKNLLRACVSPCAEGMEIRSSSPRVLSARKLAVELLLANHPGDCLTCLRNGNCELQDMASRLGVRERRFVSTRKPRPVDLSSLAIVRDESKCILCGRCVAVCRDIQSVEALDFAGRGIRTRIATFMDRGLASSDCTSCGQCSLVCPVGAIVERDETEAVMSALNDGTRTVLVQAAPAVRASLGEALGMPAGSLVTGRMVAVLRRLGFDRVFDTQFAADLTIMEEGSELLERIKNGGVLPMITSCSPAWINFIETFYPKLLPHVSTCKSPQQMFGALSKTWYAARQGLKPENMVVVSIMPCTAKKCEARRSEMKSASAYWDRRKAAKSSASVSDIQSEIPQATDYPDVDFVLTVRELARMISQRGLNISDLPSEEFDDPLGESTGAATIFAGSGGVMEAALRTVVELTNGAPMDELELSPLRGLDGIKTARVKIGKALLSVAVAQTLKNARVLLNEIVAGTSPFSFIEVMSCPGGCVGGGGQVLGGGREARAKRQEAIYLEDMAKLARKSHESESVQILYEEFLGSPLGDLSHELLHTNYAGRS